MTCVAPALKSAAVTKLMTSPSSVRSVKRSTCWIPGLTTSSKTPRADCVCAGVKVVGVFGAAPQPMTSISTTPASARTSRAAPPGGVSSGAAQLLQALRERGHDLLPIAHHTVARVLENVGVAVAIDGHHVARA